jgi:hypothetical protein
MSSNNARAESGTGTAESETRAKLTEGHNCSIVRLALEHEEGHASKTARGGNRMWELAQRMRG